MQLIDTHLHLLHPDRFTYAWAAGIPALDKALTHVDFLERAKGGNGMAQVRASLFMEVDVDESQQQAEADFFSEATQAGALAGVIPACRPESLEFAVRLEILAANPAVRGLRRVMHTQPDELLANALVRENLRRLPATGLSFDLCVLARQLPLALDLVRACPDTRFVLDHLGNPNAAAGDLDPWRANLKALSACPNVACKISGIVVQADAKRPLLPQIKPFVDHAVDCFSFDRVVWGSDWPVCELTFGLPAWLDATAELFVGASADEKLRLAQGNAKQWYRWA